MDYRAYFLGPQAENGSWTRAQIEGVLDHWFEWRKSLFPQDGKALPSSLQTSSAFVSSRVQLESELGSLMLDWLKETPKFTPRYLGHMVSEISLPGLLGSILALLHNANNASKEVARVGIRIENEAIQMLAEMIGFGGTGVGHFTSGGTIANIESLWRARYWLDHRFSLALALSAQNSREFDSVFDGSMMSRKKFNDLRAECGLKDEELRKHSFVANSPWSLARMLKNSFEGPVVLVPGNKHYSWQKAVNLLGFGEKALWSIDLDPDGRMDVESLNQAIETAKKEDRPIAMCVSVSGTTEMGEIDPVDRVQDCLDAWKKRGVEIWHHVDAAYGGYFRILQKHPLLSDNVKSALQAISRVDSVTLDPHKLGYVPYSCGAILIRDPEHDAVSQFEAPYLGAKNQDNTWSSTLEGSRAATGATSTWLSSKVLGLGENEGYFQILELGIQARNRFLEVFRSVPLIRPILPTDTNIICFNLAREGESLKATNDRTERVFKKIVDSPEFSVSKTVLHSSYYRALIERHALSWGGKVDTESLFLLRIVLMNPFLLSQEVQTKYPEEFVSFIQELASD